VLKAVLFDLDGTLVDTGEFILQSYDFALKQQGFQGITKERVAELAGMPLHSCYNRIAPMGDVEKFVRDHRAFQEKNLRMVREYKKTERLLEKIKKNGVKIAIVTGRYRKSSEMLLEKIGLKKAINALVCGDDFNESKPAAMPFKKAAEKLGIKARECLVVGDGCADITGGKAAGCKTCRAMYGYGATEECKEKADFEIKKIEEVLECIQQKK